VVVGAILWTFRRERDSTSARAGVRRAAEANRRVPKYLIGKKELPDTDPFSYGLGSEGRGGDLRLER
jgi:hypothetical protein